MGHVASICSKYFEFWLLLEQQVASKESQDQNLNTSANACLLVD